MISPIYGSICHFMLLEICKTFHIQNDLSQNWNASLHMWSRLSWSIWKILKLKTANFTLQTAVWNPDKAFQTQDPLNSKHFVYNSFIQNGVVGNSWSWKSKVQSTFWLIIPCFYLHLWDNPCDPVPGSFSTTLWLYLCLIS